MIDKSACSLIVYIFIDVDFRELFLSIMESVISAFLIVLPLSVSNHLFYLINFLYYILKLSKRLFTLLIVLSFASIFFWRARALFCDSRVIILNIIKDI
jgi:hypothetical protein